MSNTNDVRHAINQLKRQSPQLLSAAKDRAKAHADKVILCDACDDRSKYEILHAFLPSESEQTDPDVQMAFHVKCPKCENEDWILFTYDE